jgi:Type I phosphodiesterase / nucleotide pyrophosphatase
MRYTLNMLNQNALKCVQRSSFGPHFCKPLYDSYCFSRIPATIKTLLTGKPHPGLPSDAVIPEEYDIVILFLIDGFGWRFFEQYAHKYPMLKRFLEQGIATKITSQFPSTTAAHVTCINTGLDVGQSGVYEWFYYEPKLDRMIAPLLFSFAGDKVPGSLKKTGISPQELYPTHTLYEDLKGVGIPSFVLQLASIAHSPYSEVMFRGASPIPYNHYSEALSSLVTLCNTQEKAYCYLYFGDIDAAGHRHGIDSPQFSQAVDDCWKAMEELFFQKIAHGQKKIACIAVADHGMLALDPKKTFYLNKELPQISDYFKTNRQGVPLVPAGSCRDFFLHIQDERLDETVDILHHFLEGRAAVYKTQALIDQQFFGEKPPSELFLQRVGNLVILPYEEQGIWWYEKHRFEQHFYGAHGGLTRPEMETIFLFQQI